RARVPGGNGDDVIVGEEVLQDLTPAATVQPGIVLPHVQAERHRAVERKGRVLAGEVIRRGVGTFDRAGLHGVRHLQPWHQYTSREGANLELAVGEDTDALRYMLTGAVDGIQRAGKAAGHAPADFRSCLRDSGSSQSRGGTGHCTAC